MKREKRLTHRSFGQRAVVQADAVADARYINIPLIGPGSRQLVDWLGNEST